MKFKAIHNEEDYAAAMAKIEKLFGAADGSQEQSDLEVLAILVEAYERAKFPIRDADPIEMLEYAFDQQQTTPEQKARIFGGANRASEVMNRKRKLSIGMIRRAHDELGLPLEVLVREYPLDKRGRSVEEIKTLLGGMGLGIPETAGVAFRRGFDEKGMVISEVMSREPMEVVYPGGRVERSRKEKL